MQTVQELQPFTHLNKKHQSSSFELVTNWIDTGYTLNLSSNAIQLMTVLLRFYNPEKKYVFPHQETLAQRTNTSLASVKRGLNELIKAQLILKSRKQTGNVYGFTPKLFELLNGSNCTIPTAQNEPCMNRTNKKEQIKEHHHEIEAPKSKKIIDVDFSSNSHKKVTLSDVPEAIKSNKKILNPCAYWASLNEEEKKVILNKQNAELERAAKIQKIKDDEKAEQERQRAEEEAYNNLPVWEKYTREKAIRTLYATKWYYNQKKQLNSFTREFVEYYKLNADEVCTMTVEELENYIKETC